MSCSPFQSGVSMNEQIFSGPPIPRRVRAAFAYLEYVQSRLQPCCHPPGELTKQEHATEVVALRTLVQYLAGEQEFVEPMPPPPPGSVANTSDGMPSPQGATAP